MPGFNFRIALDLTSFFQDHRCRCYIYIDVSKLRTIEDLEKHIKNQFRILDDIYVSTNGYYLPSSETIEILHTNEILIVSKCEPGPSWSDNGLVKTKNSGSNRSKTKDLHSNKDSFENILKHELPFPPVSENSAVHVNGESVVSVKSTQKINNDSGVEVEEDTKCASKNETRKGNKKEKTHSRTESENNSNLDDLVQKGLTERVKKKSKKEVASDEVYDASGSSNAHIDVGSQNEVKDVLPKSAKKKSKKYVATDINTSENNFVQIDIDFPNGSKEELTISSKKKSKKHFLIKEEIDVSNNCVDQVDMHKKKRKQNNHLEENVLTIHETDALQLRKKVKRNNSLERNHVPPYNNSVQYTAEDSKQENIGNRIPISYNNITSGEKKERAGYSEDKKDQNGEEILSDDISISTNDEGIKNKKKRFRRRKRKKKNITFDPIFPMLYSVKENLCPPPKAIKPSVNHVRFTSDEEEVGTSKSELAKTSTPLIHDKENVNFIETKPSICSVSRWDEKPPERKDLLSPLKNNSALTLDEVYSKTLPALKYHSTALIFDCTKTEKPKPQSTTNEVPEEIRLDVDEVQPPTDRKTLDVVAASSPLHSQPRKNDLIAFKMFRLSENYTPVLSNHITARVLNYDADSFTARLQIIEGQKELAEPKGRFSLEEEDAQTQEEFLELNWNEMLEPRLIFP